MILSMFIICHLVFCLLSLPKCNVFGLLTTATLVFPKVSNVMQPWFQSLISHLFPNDPKRQKQTYAINTHVRTHQTRKRQTDSLSKGNGSHPNPNLCRHSNPCIHTQTDTNIKQESTEWHLNMLSWHRACRHGGEMYYGMCPWDFTLYIFSL